MRGGSRRRSLAGFFTGLVFAASFLFAGEGARTHAGGEKDFKRAERAMREGDFEAAEKIYRSLIAKEKDVLEARLGLSHALLKQRKNQDAYDHAARVLALDPLSHRAHSLLGLSLLASGEFRVSVEEFRTALSFKDDDAMAVAGLAMVDFYENRLRSSLAGLRRAAFIDPNEPDYQFNLGQVAARSELYREAADAYERFLKIAPRADVDRRERIRGLIDFLRFLGTRTNLNNAAGSSRTVVPFELVNNRPIVSVRINGSKTPLRFVIDTGAGMCVISRNTAERLNLRPVARGGMARAIGGGGRFEIVYGFLDSMQVSDARLENVPVYIREFLNREEPVDGYIGLSLLSKYLTMIDYGARTMTLLRDDARPEYDPTKPPVGFEIPIRITSSGFWSGEVKFPDLKKPANFIVDTGASISVVSKALAAREGLSRFPESTRIQVYGAAGLEDDVRTLILPELQFGPLVRANVTAAVIDMEAINETSGFEQAGIIGGNMLRYFRLTMDFSRGVIQLEPLESAEIETRVKAAPVISNQP